MLPRLRKVTNPELLETKGKADSFYFNQDESELIALRGKKVNIG
jgi:hypothetical protein